MGDLISRQDAINTALEFFVEFLGGAFHEDDQKILMKRMNELPSAEPEVIRCKDCKYYYREKMFGDNGLTRFPNEILEELYCSGLNSSQLSILLYLVRKIHGFNKESARLSLSRMAQDIHKSRRSITKEISNLEKSGIIIIERQGQGKLSNYKIEPPDRWFKHGNCDSHIKDNSIDNAM